MPNSTKRAVRHRYLNARNEAYQATQTTLGGIVKTPYYLSELTNKMDQCWREQWFPFLDREPPNGGWDWPEIHEHFRKYLDRFELAIFSPEDRLYGLAVGKTNKHATVVHYLERDPRPDAPVAGQVLLIILQAATCYAQALGKPQLWLLEPSNEGLIETYEALGFKTERARNKQQRTYCWREV